MVWLDVEMKCYVLVEFIVAAVLGRLKLSVLASSPCMRVILFILLGVVTVFLVSEVSCLSICLPSILLMWLFLPSNREFSVEYRCLVIFDLSLTNLNLISSSGLILLLISTVKVLSKKFSDD